MSKGSWPARVLLIIAALSGGSCVSIEQSAPRVETLAPTMRLGAVSHLEHGRDIYVTKCAECHQVEPVRNYPASEWENTILPEMNEEAKLSATEAAAVRAYVMSVLRSPAA
jgi:mono/diheme cytochrome c family protein